MTPFSKHEYIYYIFKRACYHSFYKCLLGWSQSPCLLKELSLQLYTHTAAKFVCYLPTYTPSSAHSRAKILIQGIIEPVQNTVLPKKYFLFVK